MKTLVSLVALFVTTTSAHAAAPLWWAPLPFDRDVEVDQDRIGTFERAVPRTDTFEPLWNEHAYLAEMKAAYGAPDSEEGQGATWRFAGLEVRIDATQPGKTSITLSPHPHPEPRTFDPARIAFGAYVPATKGCDSALALLGKPSTVELRGEILVWKNFGRGRRAKISLVCYGSNDSSMIEIGLTTLVPERLAPFTRPATPASLPKTFTPGWPDKATPADPRPLWPRGLAPGQPIAAALATLGPPGSIEPGSDGDDFLAYGDALGIYGDDANRITMITIGTQVAELQRQLGLTSPLFAVIGKSFTVVDKLLGPPVAHELGQRAWVWDAGGHELSIHVTERDGIVSEVMLLWQPPIERNDLIGCLSAIDAAPGAPGAPPPATRFTSPETGLALTQADVLPFGLWFGASKRDVIDRIGLPRLCGPTEMSYRGIAIEFDDDEELESISMMPKLLLAELRDRRDPLIALLMQPQGATYFARFGPAAGAARAHLFERGNEHVSIASHFDAGEALPYYYVGLARGFAFDGIEGIDVLNLDASVARLASPHIKRTRSEDATLVEIPLSAKAALADRVRGRFMDLLGTPWSAVMAALGDPSSATTTTAHVELTWMWPEDPYGRTLTYRCSGTTLSCDTLVLGRSREAEAP